MSGRVVIHTDENGNWTVYFDDDVQVFSVDELAPSDRVYAFGRNPIPDGILDGEVHHMNDGSAAAARVSRAIRNAHGFPAFDVIGGDASE